MGFSYRKSFKLAPGVRMTVSKSGIGYSVGGKGVRVTKRARGGVQTTLHVPGTGLSYTTSSSTSTRKRSKSQPSDNPPRNAATTGKSRRSRRRTSINTSPSQEQATMSQPIPQENRTPSGNQVAQQPPTGRSNLAPGRDHREIRIAGRWYYVVLIATAGVFAWIPFLHAAVRLKTAKARRLALIFGGLDALIYALLAITPQDSHGQATNGPISTIGGLLALGTIIVGCVMVAPLRRMAYEGEPTDADDGLSTADPAIKAALAARTRRDEARKLAIDDPLLARELLIGRPDTARTYDDGGLVDLNNAAAEAIAKTCGIPTDVAAGIVDARNQRGEPFTNIDELFVMVDVPVSMWDRIRDRAILGRAIGSVFAKIAEVAQRLKGLLGVRVTEATTEAASKAPTLAKDAEAVATDDLTAAARDAHARDLGMDPATKGFRQSEADTGQWQNLQNQIVKHLDKADYVPVDVSQFTPAQIAQVKQFIGPLGPHVLTVGG